MIRETLNPNNYSSVKFKLDYTRLTSSYNVRLQITIYGQHTLLLWLALKQTTASLSTCKDRYFHWMFVVRTNWKQARPESDNARNNWPKAQTRICKYAKYKSFNTSSNTWLHYSNRVQDKERTLDSLNLVEDTSGKWHVFFLGHT